MHFLSSKEGQRGIIFCKTKAAVNKLAKNLAINKFSSGSIHGSLTQGIRDRIMGQFREGHIDILVATDLAARGIDVKEISYVVNYHLPDTFEAYVHRSGRTARAGAKGLVINHIYKKKKLKILLILKANWESNLAHSKKRMHKVSKKITDCCGRKKYLRPNPIEPISDKFRTDVSTVFHHLTKEELIEKVLANYLAQTGSNHSK